MQQKTLPIHPDNQPSVNNFYAATEYTRKLIYKLSQSIQQQDHHHILIGASGSGKSHLLKAYCLQHSSKWCYIPCKKLHKYTPDILDDLSHHLVCLDDIHYLVGNAAWERAIFSLLVKSTNTKVLMSSDNAVANTGVELPDLRSRLAAITSIKLPSLDEDQQRLALSWRAQARGIQLNTKMLTWLQTHAPRDNHALFSILEKIDQHCLATHTKPSTALINNIIDNISTHHPND